MKIASIETGVVALPNDEPLAGFSENPNAKNPMVTLRVGTDEGVEGIGVTYFGGALTRTLKRAVDDLGALVIGEDPLRPEAIAAKLRAAAGGSGPAGIFTMALSAIDVALWDIKGKASGLPLWKLLGGGRDRIATYASGALRRGLKLEEAVTAAGRLREKGHRQTKMQLGLPGITSPAREVEQARLIREAVGPDMDLMCDINQRWRVEQAIDIGKRVEDSGVGLFWLEDVTTHDDYAGLARVTGASDARRRRRIPLGHRAVPPHDRGPLGRHRDDRPGALWRHHPLAEDRRHGRSLQPAGRQPRRARDPRAPRRRGPQRAYGRVHAPPVPSVGRGAGAGRRRARNADRSRARAQIRRESD
jgi:L-alanine-DL-glutamate epimerase-like enolase superfamily enzyme